jgi:hypothetical protein
MIKMIRLFQAKGNLAWEKYLNLRGQTIEKVPLNSPEWHSNNSACARLKAESDTWAKAAELLRKEQVK